MVAPTRDRSHRRNHPYRKFSHMNTHTAATATPPAKTTVKDTDGKKPIRLRNASRRRSISFHHGVCTADANASSCANSTVSTTRSNTLAAFSSRFAPCELDVVPVYESVSRVKPSLSATRPLFTLSAPTLSARSSPTMIGRPSASTLPPSSGSAAPAAPASSSRPSTSASSSPRTSATGDSGSRALRFSASGTCERRMRRAKTVPAMVKTTPMATTAAVDRNISRSLVPVLHVAPKNPGWHSHERVSLRYAPWPVHAVMHSEPLHGS
mmetsp:Transcript_19556/g.69238  ORF Transcript_19556/g.69238 Transcript_19556/m.69238 type:complete len:267 (+) Transcript_19556:248-1048(+)